MLSASPAMLDIDVNQWRNLHTLILESASARPRIVLIHEDGELLKFVHSQGADVAGNVERVDDPREVAKQVYNANSGNADFAVVFERRAVDHYFARVQDTWSADEDVDEYVHRMYASLDDYPEGIAVYPGPASTTLGLQWRLGASYAEVRAAVERFVPPETTVVFGIFEDDALWASLVLGFGADKRIEAVTTADTSEITTGGGFEAISRDIVAWVNREYPHCSLGLFTDLDGARALLRSQDKPAAIRDIVAGEGRLLADPLPEQLSRLFATS